MSDQINPDRFSDSSGVPWQGRHFEPNPHASDDGSADPALIQAIKDFQANTVDADAVVDAFRRARLLVPLLADLGSEGVGAHGQTVDKSADLSIVTVLDPDGRMALPVFSSVEAMARWNPAARPVPADAIRVCLAAAQEDDANARVILDPGSDTEFALRRPAIAAVAQQKPWVPPYRDQVVLDAFARALDGEQAVRKFGVLSTDQFSRLEGQEIGVLIWLEAGLTAQDLKALEERFVGRWSQDKDVVERVESLSISFRNASDLDQKS